MVSKWDSAPFGATGHLIKIKAKEGEALAS